MRNPTSGAGTAPDTTESGRSGPVREVALIALAAVVVYVLLALASWSPADPGVTHAGTHLTVVNLVGISGAYTADAALFALGWLAYLIPAGLAAAAVAMLRRRWATSWSEACLRVAGFVAFLLAACAVVALHATDARLPAGAGGAIGQQLVTAGMPVLNKPGVTLVAFTALAVGLQTAIGFSWLWLVESMGRLVFGVASATVGGMVAAMRLPGRLMRPKRSEATVLAPAPAPAEVEKPVPARRGNRPARTPPAVVPLPPVAADETLERPDPGHTPLPELDLLDQASGQRLGYSGQSLDEMSRLLEARLDDFGVEAEVKAVLPGPVVTRFELELAAGVKVSKIAGLAKDLARSLAVISVRIVEVIPGKSVIGIEIPNKEREVVRLREILDSDVFREATDPLTLALGKDISGEPVLAEVGRMPHLLVAGTTGSGKSVGINAMLVSMLYKASPERLRFILVDPKMLELAVYEGIPHLLTPVVTDMKDAAAALNWCVGEMDRRYRLMAGLGVRNLAGYNRRLAEAEQTGTALRDPNWPPEHADAAPPLRPLPYIVVVIDEFADMMMIVGKKVDQLIARIAQKARAAGIHLILATQRPSVDVITGLIKANIPARIGFQVSSKVDSRTILDQGGAEQLLGHGDMLFLPPGTAMPTRVHGAFVSDDEVHRVVADWKARGRPEYLEDVLAASSEVVPLGAAATPQDGDVEASDALYDQAVAFVLESRRASISSVQRKFRIGYNRSARLIEAMEEAGVVSPMSPSGGREVLVPHRE